MEAKIQFQAPWNKIDEIVDALQAIDSSAKIVINSKTPVRSSITDRKPLNQIEVYEIVMSALFSKFTEEGYKYFKEEITAYFKRKNIQSKILENNKLED